MYRLTPREKQILKYIAIGKTAEEIGLILDINKRTVDNYKLHLYKKFNCSNSAHLVYNAMREGHLNEKRNN